MGRGIDDGGQKWVEKFLQERNRSCDRRAPPLQIVDISASHQCEIESSCRALVDILDLAVQLTASMLNCLTIE